MAVQAKRYKAISYMSYQNYQQIKQLHSSHLKELLSSGDAPERVWAAWEIGLRLGRDALPSVSLQAHHAPDPGTRRHLVVILAGLGHYSILSTLAQHDPDESVRGTTAQYLIQIMHETEREKIELLLKILQDDTSSIVKRELLENWSTRLPQIPLPLLLHCARHPSEAVRKAALTHLFHHAAAADTLSHEQLISCLIKQRTQDALTPLSQWLIEHQKEELILTAAERADNASRCLMLDILAENGIVFPWMRLKTLAQKKNPPTDVRVLKILSIAPSAELVLWLAFGIARSINWSRVTTLHPLYEEQQHVETFGYLAIRHFWSLIETIPPQSCSSLERQYFQAILNHVENDIAYFSECDDEFWEDEGIDTEEELTAMQFRCDCIQAWLAA